MADSDIKTGTEQTKAGDTVDQTKASGGAAEQTTTTVDTGAADQTTEQTKAGESKDSQTSEQTKAAATQTTTTETKVEPKEDWRDARIRVLTAKLNDARKEKAAEQVQPVAGETREQLDARVEARAKELAGQSDWNNRCNAVAVAGRAAYTDFAEKLRGITSLVDGNDPAEVSSYNSFLAAAMETGEAPKLIYELGANPNEAARILALSPMKMAVELTRLATPRRPAEPSNAAKPITPVGSRGIHYEAIQPDDAERGTRLPIADWMAQREKQARERGLQ